MQNRVTILPVPVPPDAGQYYCYSITAATTLSCLQCLNCGSSMAEASDNNGAGDSMDIVPPEVRGRLSRSFRHLPFFLEQIYRDTWSHLSAGL